MGIIPLLTTSNINEIADTSFQLVANPTESDQVKQVRDAIPCLYIFYNSVFC